MSAPIIWHNPRCSKSRAGLVFLQARGLNPQVRLYLKDAPDLDELRAMQAALGVPAIAMMRPCEPAFKAAGVAKDSPDAALLALMADTAQVIERPIVLWNGRAVIGRPTESIAALFD